MLISFLFLCQILLAIPVHPPDSSAVIFIILHEINQENQAATRYIFRTSKQKIGAAIGNTQNALKTVYNSAGKQPAKIYMRARGTHGRSFHDAANIDEFAEEIFAEVELPNKALGGAKVAAAGLLGLAGGVIVARNQAREKVDLSVPNPASPDISASQALKAKMAQISSLNGVQLDKDEGMDAIPSTPPPSNRFPIVQPQ
jgi:hypothetical protein